MKKGIKFVFTLAIALALGGCNSNDDEDGGFIRETYSGIVKEKLSENEGDFLKVNITDENEMITFSLTDGTKVEGAVECFDDIEVGDRIEIDCVHRYEPLTYEVLILTIEEKSAVN